MKKMYEKLEYNKILEMIADFALSNRVKSRINALEPYLKEADVRRHMEETTDGRRIILQMGNPPLAAMVELEKVMALLGKDALLSPEQLTSVAQFLTACRRMKSYLAKAESFSSGVALYGHSIYDLSALEDEITLAIRGGRVDDKASPALSSIRRKILLSGEQIKSRVDSLFKNNKNWFSEGFVSVRNGHYTMPVKREYKSKVSGTVIDVSQSGGTYFIEPGVVIRLQEELAVLRMEEENEVRRILYMLTALVEEQQPYISINIEAMETLDFVFAKARLSIAMKAVPARVESGRRIDIRQGRHPLLPQESAVPLDFRLGGDIRGIVITGPNTGGKTVALKTVGLLSLMAQSGLHVPVEDGIFSMHNYVLCDIGDGQSIAENLSTFSSHMTNIIDILRQADEESLVLLDELGSGTDPAEGMGLAISILEVLAARNCLFVATTHYPEVKDFASATNGLINARMTFDLATLQPMYYLEIGEAGESCALHIAARLGLPEGMIDRAREAAYEGVISSDTPVDAQVLQQDNQNRRKIIRQQPAKISSNAEMQIFNMGDSVLVLPEKEIGIVYRSADEKGEVIVQIKGKKERVNHKRLKLHVPASQLYPEDYDFSIIFDSVENRKARHVMDRKYDPDAVVQLNDMK